MNIRRIVTALALIFFASSALAQTTNPWPRMIPVRPDGSVIDPGSTGGGGGGTVTQGPAATDAAGNRWPVLSYQGGGAWSVSNPALIPDAAIPSGSPFTLPTGSAANSILAQWDVTGAGSVDLYVTSFGGALALEEQASDGSGNWWVVPVTNVSNMTTGAARVFGSIYTGGLWRASVNGKTLRLRVGATTTATSSVAIVNKTAQWSAPSQFIEGGALSVAPSTAATSGIVPTVARGATVLTAKASAGNLYGFSLTQGATAGFFAFVDAAAAPAAGAAIAPVECVAVPASGYVARRQDIADRYVSGIQVLSTTSCTTYTANTPVQISASVQ